MKDIHVLRCIWWDCCAQEEQFERTCDLVREVGFDRVNTAAYSPRPGTPAAKWGNQVADLVKMDRLNRLNRIVNIGAEERAQRFLGKDTEVRGLALLNSRWHAFHRELFFLPCHRCLALRVCSFHLL